MEHHHILVFGPCQEIWREYVQVHDLVSIPHYVLGPAFGHTYGNGPTCRDPPATYYHMVKPTLLLEYLFNYPVDQAIFCAGPLSPVSLAPRERANLGIVWDKFSPLRPHDLAILASNSNVAYRYEEIYGGATIGRGR